MDITYIEGDLIKAGPRVICHGCNARGSMGAGLAFHLRKPYPEIYDDYRRVFTEQGNRLELGQTIWTRCRDGRLIVNAITQATYGRDPHTVYADYDAIAAAMAGINAVALKTQADPAAAAAHGGVIDRVGLPKIGAGLANGDWSVIAEIVARQATAFQPVVYIHDGS